jgi:HEAT repeat protein
MSRRKIQFVNKFLIVVALLCLKNACSQPLTSATVELWKYGVQNTIPTLRTALTNPHAEVRSIAAGLLAEDKDVGSIPLLRAALVKESNREVKASIAAALASLHTWQDTVLLIEVCNGEGIDHIARLDAANKVLDNGSWQCTASVASLLGGATDPPSRELSLQYLRRGYSCSPGSPRTGVQAFALDELLDPVPLNRQYASEILSMCGSHESIRALEHAIAVEPDVATRQRLAENLKRMKSRFS